MILGISLTTIFILNQNIEQSKFAFAENQSITIITIANDGSSLSGAEFSITPNPFTNEDSFVISDNSSDDTVIDKNGVITITGIKNTKYTITQLTTPEGYKVNPLSKISIIDNSSDVVIFKNTPNNSPNSYSIYNIKDITYTAKFVCGSVFGN